jgi:hypothetical protein
MESNDSCCWISKVSRLWIPFQPGVFVVNSPLPILPAAALADNTTIGQLAQIRERGLDFIC